MRFPKWQPGLAGLIYLPPEGTFAGQKNRPYFIVEVDEKRQCTVREGPMGCEKANERISQLAKQEGKTAFSAPIKNRLQNFRSQGYFRFDPANIQELPPLPEEIADPESIFEGAKRQIFVNAYERNPEARRKCISHYGTSCVACGFNFSKRYGLIGKDFIHIHHLKPISEIGAEYKINPISDLTPVCPNCHAIIHKGKHVYSIKEVKKFIRENGGAFPFCSCDEEK